MSLAAYVSFLIVWHRAVTAFSLLVVAVVVLAVLVGRRARHYD